MKLRYYYVRYDATLGTGKQFQIEVLYDKDFSTQTHYLLRSSLHYNLASNRHLVPFIERATRINISPAQRDVFVQELIEAIKTNSEIVDDSAFLIYLLRKKFNLKVLMPYSITCNFKTFEEVNKILSKAYEGMERFEIPKDEFERFLEFNPALQDAYVDVFAKNAKYLLLKKSSENILIEVLLMAIDGNAIYYFFKTLHFGGFKNA